MHINNLILALPLALALGLFEANGADSALRLGSPLVQQKTNFHFSSQNPAPECPCDLLSASALTAPITWTTLVHGLPSQTTFDIVSSGSPKFFRLRYKPYIQAPASVYASMQRPRAMTDIQLLPFAGTGQLSLSVAFGPLSFGNTAGLTLIAGGNGLPAITVAGQYQALSNALRTLTYTSFGGVGATDTLNIALSNFGASSRCVDSNSISIPLNSPPNAYNADFIGVGQLDLPAPGLLGGEFVYDLEGDPMAIVPQSIVGAYGQLTLRVDGSLTYRPASQPTTPIVEFLSFQVYDTFGGGIHSTSTPQRLTIEIDPLTHNPR